MKKLPILILFKGAGGDADWIMPILYKLSNKYEIYSYFRSHKAYQSIKNNNEIFHFWKKINKGYFMKAYYKYKNKVTDDLEDAYQIIKMVGRSITENKTDKESTLDNLARALKKLESAKYYIDRE